MSKYFLGIDIAKLKFDAALLFDNKYKKKRLTTIPKDITPYVNG